MLISEDCIAKDYMRSEVADSKGFRPHDNVWLTRDLQCVCSAPALCESNTLHTHIYIYRNNRARSGWEQLFFLPVHLGHHTKAQTALQFVLGYQLV